MLAHGIRVGRSLHRKKKKGVESLQNTKERQMLSTVRQTKAYRSLGASYEGRNQGCRNEAHLCIIAGGFPGRYGQILTEPR